MDKRNGGLTARLAKSLAKSEATPDGLSSIRSRIDRSGSRPERTSSTPPVGLLPRRDAQNTLSERLDGLAPAVLPAVLAASAPVSHARSAAASTTEHPNVVAAREILAEMFRRESAGDSGEDCIACSLLDSADQAKACATAPLQKVRADRSNAQPRPRNRAQAKSARTRTAFSIGLASGTVGAVMVGMFGTAVLYDTPAVTAAPHHAIPYATAFAFSLARPEVHDAGPAWAWREAVSMRTVRHLTEQRQEMRTAWSRPLQGDTTAVISASAATRQALPTTTQRQPHHVMGNNTQARLELGGLANGYDRAVAGSPSSPEIGRHLETASAGPLPPIGPAAGVATPDATKPGIDTAKRTPPAATKPAKTSVEPVAKTAGQTTHHLLMKAGPSSAPIRAAAVRKSKTVEDNDDDNGDIAHVPAPKPRLIATSSGAANLRKPMALGAGDIAIRPGKAASVDAAAAKPSKWWKAPMPEWAPFKN